MIVKRRRSGTRKRKVNILIDKFIGASNKLLDEAMIKPSEAVTARNLIQVQDGRWKDRWGTQYYGVDAVSYTLLTLPTICSL